MLIDSWNGSYSKCRNVPDPGPTHFHHIPRSGVFIVYTYNFASLPFLFTLVLGLYISLGQWENQSPEFPHSLFIPKPENLASNQ